MVDLCVGPHIPHTGKIKAFMVTKNSASYFLGDANNDSLQRIYGISFPDKKQLTEYKAFLAEAAKRDHRKIGKEQELFFFNDHSPGSAFFLPHGTRIYNALVDLMRVSGTIQNFLLPLTIDVDGVLQTWLPRRYSFRSPISSTETDR